MSKLLTVLNKNVIVIILISISVLLILIGLILVSPFFFIDNVLTISYKKTKISNSMSGYILYYSLSGQIEDKIYDDIVGIENYKDKSYKVRLIKMDIDEEADSEENDSEDYLYYVIDGIAYSKDDKNKYHKIKEKVIYNNTEIYLKGLINAKEIVYVGKENLEDNEYEKYTFIIDTKIMKEILKYSNIPDLIFDKETMGCVAWIDSEGYLYKLDYDISTGLNKSTSLMVRVFMSSYNQVTDFTESTEVK